MGQNIKADIRTEKSDKHFNKFEEQYRKVQDKFIELKEFKLYDPLQQELIVQKHPQELHIFSSTTLTFERAQFVKRFIGRYSYT